MDYKEIYEREHVQNGLSYSKIREKYNIPRGTWDYYVRKKLGNRCDLRKYRCNDDFFDVIDSEIKAYLLGFLYADGYLASDGRIGIRLKHTDIEIIELIKRFICPDSTIQYTNNQNFRRSPQVSIRFKSKRIYQRLEELGFYIDKTGRDSNIFDNIPEEFKIPFIRGYTDGDGCVGLYKRKICTDTYRRPQLSYSNGSKQILVDIQKYFSDIHSVVRSAYSKSEYYLLGFYSPNNAAKAIIRIYENSTYHLNRKKEIANKVHEYYTNTVLSKENKKSLPV